MRRMAVEQATREPILPSPEEADALAVTRGSVVWRYSSDARGLITGSGVALLLQVAHPTVAAGVREHSDFERDPWGRLWRTLDFVNLFIYAGPEAAARTGRVLREMHRSIKGVAPDGRRYHALEPEAYAWVHATLCDAILGSHRLFGQRMRPDEVHAFYAEWRALGRLLGVRDRDLPEDWAGFRRYVDEMVDARLEDNDVVRTVLRTMKRPKPPPYVDQLPPSVWRVLRAPSARASELATIALLPPKLRAKLGLHLDRRGVLELRAFARASRAATPLMPEGLLRMGPGYLRARRRAMARGEFASAAAVARAA
jgi:uncharacterized protein (DUF2236 family)